MDITPLNLPAIGIPWMERIIKNPDFLGQIADNINGPFHLLEPETFRRNLTTFEDILQKYKVKGQVFYAKKANKAAIWLKIAALYNGYADVASVPEFVHALACGIKAAHICVTGAAKSNDLLRLANQHNALVAIDALDELDRAVEIAEVNQPLRILLRVLPPEFPDSRFGLNAVDMQIALQKCADNRHLTIMEGFSFHLDGYEVGPRVKLGFQLIKRCLEARSYGLEAHSISIGGGFACAYTTEDHWNRFQENLSPAQFHSHKNFAKFYPYHQAPTGAAMLDAILGSFDGEYNFAHALNHAGIKLLMEPGRALLDGAGVSVFPVQGFKQNDAHGIITVAGLSMSLSEQWKASEFLPDPRLLQRGSEREQKAVIACIGGSSCMEYDMLSWRKISFPARPRYGDLIIYPNTAGYQMDKNESTFHQLALPPKIIIWQNKNSIDWSIDQ